MGRWKRDYARDMRVLELVQAARIARMTWAEADTYLQAHGIKMSEKKYHATKRYLEDSVLDRIKYIATSEYADMHLQLLDKAKAMFSRLEQMAQDAQAENDHKKELKVYEETRQTVDLIKQLYNSNTIVAGVTKLVKDARDGVPEGKRASEVYPDYKKKLEKKLEN